MTLGRLNTERQLRQAININSRAAKRAAEEDIIIDSRRRLILRSPDGHFWKIGVDDTGLFTATDIGTSL